MCVCVSLSVCVFVSFLTLMSVYMNDNAALICLINNATDPSTVHEERGKGGKPRYGGVENMGLPYKGDSLVCTQKKKQKERNTNHLFVSQIVTQK